MGKFLSQLEETLAISREDRLHIRASGGIDFNTKFGSLIKNIFNSSQLSDFAANEYPDLNSKTIFADSSGKIKYSNVHPVGALTAIRIFIISGIYRVHVDGHYTLLALGRGNNGTKEIFPEIGSKYERLRVGSGGNAGEFKQITKYFKRGARIEVSIGNDAAMRGVDDDGSLIVDITARKGHGPAGQRFPIDSRVSLPSKGGDGGTPLSFLIGGSGGSGGVSGFSVSGENFGRLNGLGQAGGYGGGGGGGIGGGPPGQGGPAIAAIIFDGNN